MEYIEEDLKNGNWDRLSKPLQLLKTYIDVDEVTGQVHLGVHIVPDKVVNKFGMSILDMVLDVKKQACLYEIPITDTLAPAADIIVGFVPHPDARDIVNVKVVLESLKKPFFWFLHKKEEWVVQVFPSPKKYTPFLWGKFAFPRISFANWAVKIVCESEFKPVLLCANVTNVTNVTNVQTDERKKLAYSNIYRPDNTLLFPRLQGPMRNAEKLVLRYI
jgi:hypothetical protein